MVDPGDPRLIDRTRTLRLATTDPVTNTIYLSNDLRAPLIDRVLLHEVAHAVTMSYGLLDDLHASLPIESWIPAEEWSARLLEVHGMEAIALASESLGRPLCIKGYCSQLY